MLKYRQLQGAKPGAMSYSLDPIMGKAPRAQTPYRLTPERSSCENNEEAVNNFND